MAELYSAFQIMISWTIEIVHRDKLSLLMILTFDQSRKSLGNHRILNYCSLTTSGSMIFKSYTIITISFMMTIITVMMITTSHKMTTRSDMVIASAHIMIAILS